MPSTFFPSFPLKEKLPLLRYALWVPVYLLLFVLLEQRNSPGSCWSSDLPIDQLIPFCPAFLIFYCLWYPLLVGMGLYLLGYDPRAYRRYMAYLAITFFLSELIWFLVPSQQNLRPQLLASESLFTPGFTLLYRIDTNTNVFPSAHVVGAVGAALAAWDCPRLRKRKAVLTVISLLAALICLSTVLVKQHAVLDMIGGLVLSALAAAWVYRRPGKYSPPPSEPQPPA